MTQMIRFVPEAGLQPNGKELALALRTLARRIAVWGSTFAFDCLNTQPPVVFDSRLKLRTPLLAYAQLTAFIQHTLVATAG